MKSRKQVTYNEILDLLGDQRPGQYVCFSYVTLLNTYKDKSSYDASVINPILKNLKGQHYNAFIDYLTNDNILDVPIKYIVKLKRYVLNWSSEKTFCKNYGELFANPRTELNLRYMSKYPDLGIQQKDGNSHIIANSYGIGTDTVSGALKFRQNTAKANTKESFYFISDNGKISDPCDDQLANHIIKKTATSSIVPAVVRKNFSQADEQNYEQVLQGIYSNFSPQEFFLDKVLYIVATVNGVAYYYINEKVLLKVHDKIAPKTYNDYEISTQDLVKIAKNELDKAIQSCSGGIFENLSQRISDIIYKTIYD